MKSNHVVRLHTGPSSRQTKHHIRQNPQNIEVVLKYELPNSKSSSCVVWYFDLDTSNGYDVSRVCEFVEWELRPLRCLH